MRPIASVRSRPLTISLAIIESVVRWNHSISVSGGIDTHAGAAWRLKSGDAASRWNKSLGIFGVDAALDGVPGKVNFAHGVVELLAGCDSNLGLDEIRTRDEFGDRMFNLNARVHLNKVNLAVLIH